MNQTPAHRWLEHVPPDMCESSSPQFVSQFRELSNVSWDIPTEKPKRHVEVWMSELARVVPHIAKALAQKHRSIVDIEARLTVLEKELVSLKEQFQKEEVFDRELAAEIADLKSEGTLPEDADPIDLLPTADQLRELFEE